MAEVDTPKTNYELFLDHIKTGIWPQDSCDKCLQEYWACACGASPMKTPGGKEQPPEKCKNQYCRMHETRPDQFRWISTRTCCQSYGHHHLNVCSHCGDNEINPRKWLFREL